MKEFKGTYYCQVKLVHATESDLRIEKVQLKALKTDIELLELKLQVSEANSERWKRKYDGMSDRIYGPVEDSSRNSSRESVKIAATPNKRLCMAVQ
jgi:hypothetical protein